MDMASSNLNHGNSDPSGPDDPMAPHSAYQPKRQPGASTKFPVVGIGGSAGSLDSLRILLSALPDHTTAAYVIVVHLSPEHDSNLAEILQQSTPLPVVQVLDSVRLKPGIVHVIPPGRQFVMAEGLLKAVVMPQRKGRHVTVDLFFRALAETHRNRAIAIVLSGGDGDGSIGIKRIKERGGLTIAQDPSEAEHPGMPKSAIETGMIDWILPIDEMPGKLLEYWENGSKLQLPSESDEHSDTAPAFGPEDEAALGQILSHLKSRTGHDFKGYKRATILRRITRRMQVNGAADLNRYMAYQRLHPGESGALLQDLLISVTNFFRDKEAFESLESIIPEIFKNKSAGEEVRVWVPACATGEEAYSLAMLLREYAARLTHPPTIQIFATDLDRAAIDTAREGRFPGTIRADVSEERLLKFFIKEGEGFRVCRELREIILFATHDLLRDSPFSRLDLVSCRNLLIYLNNASQSKVFDIFDFTLRSGGYLFLGSSETVEQGTGIFEPIDKNNRIYQHKDTNRIGRDIPAGAPTLAFSLQQASRKSHLSIFRARGLVSESHSLPDTNASTLWSELHVKLIEHVSPPSIVVNPEYEVVHVSKNGAKFLRFNAGQPTLNLLNLIHHELRTELRAALFRASKADHSIRSSGVALNLDGNPQQVFIRVEPLRDLTKDFMLVVFEESDVTCNEEVSNAKRSSPDPDIIRYLEDELDHLRASWRSTTEQHEASSEELTASNEELHAMNEELRSTTEELETGREELQSINEQITLGSQELGSKVEELARANGDLQNLMASTRIATIFVDSGLRIKRFTPSTAGLYSFIPADCGRPLADLTLRLEYTGLMEDAAKVLRDHGTLEREVRNVDGLWFLLRLTPYKTSEDQVAGVVITFIDISERKANEDSRRWLSAIVESSNDAIISFGMDGNILSWNRGAEQIFGYTAAEMIGRSNAMLAPPELQGEKRQMLEQLQRGETIASFETVRVRKDGRRIDVSLSASVMVDKSGKILAATAIARDITLRKQALEELKQARNELESRVDERTQELRERVAELAHMASEVTMTELRERRRMAAILHDELQQLLVSIKMRIESLGTIDEADRGRETETLSAMMEEVLANSRSLATDLSPSVLNEGLAPSLEWLAHSWMKEKYNLLVHSKIEAGLDTGRDDTRSLVFFAVKELLFNVVKHSKVMEAYLNLEAESPSRLKITVRDHGMGFDQMTATHPPSGSGLGLAGLSERLKMLGGTLKIVSRSNGGVEAVITVPTHPVACQLVVQEDES